MELGLAGKTAFISGATRGIGLAIARAFLAEGAGVALTGRNTQTLAAARIGLATEFPKGRIAAIAADMADESAATRALDEAEAALGPINAAVANAGTGKSAAGYALQRSDWAASLEANLMTGAILASAVLPRLARRKTGSLTFITSIAGLEAIGAPVPYAAAKAALQAATSSYARLAGADGVRVNAVAPGNVLFPGGAWEQRLAEKPGRYEKMILSEVPLTRFASPAEIADMVVFLASDRASFVTGATMVVDGGQTRSF
ncbi:MAG TPA: SDR family oxidoreductase [Rhizomicrobium sp.]|jgi:3-oxoacyl-[acyl-carrier protein] reductase|nr:SDR family oxidoreductase [Rhizomicrobium sp.]